MCKLQHLMTGVLLTVLMLVGCSAGAYKEENQTMAVPKIPEKLIVGKDNIPIIDVYDVEQKKIDTMDIEEYVMGVVAGEMKNDWPLEALKAQAILARTFVLKFCDTKQSQYEGADISTDVSEAQAYAPERINDRVRQAVKATKGEVMSADGDYPHAWFFAHAAGKTELPSAALDYKKGDPPYLAVTESPDSEMAPDDVKNWTAEFKFEEIIAACRQLGAEIDNIDSVEIGKKGTSGRTRTLRINNQEISAPSLRIRLGAQKLKSTLWDSVEADDGKVIFKGRGFGHGVGMSQWGAFEMAKNGKRASEIVEYYFRGIDLIKLW